MEALLGAAAGVGLWAGTLAWALALGVSCFAVLFALPGGWVALGLAILYDALFGFGAIGPPRLAVFALLLALGEAVEALLGSAWVAAKGGTRWGVAGGVLGGIAGALGGSVAAPFLGTFVGGAAGAFVGTVAGEMLRDRRLEPALRIGLHATAGRLAAAALKGTLAAAGAGLVAAAAFRRLAV